MPEWFVTLGTITLTVMMVGFLLSIISLIAAFAYVVIKEWIGRKRR